MLNFQIVDILSDDLPNPDKDESKLFQITLYGKTEDNQTVICNLINYKPYFYLKIPDNWTKTTIKRFIIGDDSNESMSINKLLNDGPEGVNQAISLMEMIPEYGIKSVSYDGPITTLRFEAPEGTSYDHSMGAVESEFIYRHLKHAGVPVGEFYSDDTKAIITIRNQDF